MTQEWFEMPRERRRTLENATWIPLRARECIDEQGKFGRVGYLEDFLSVGTLAVPLERRHEAETLDWTSIGPGHTNGGYVEENVYVPSDVRSDVSGLYLALEQRGNDVDHAQWHLHQDFVITLGLKREGDLWLSLSEGYLEVARLSRKQNGAPALLKVKASHLRDYLRAREMALRVASFRYRTEVVENADHVTWSGGRTTDETETDKWEAEVMAIHEGGGRFGAERAVLHVARTDVDVGDDVPVLDAPGTGDTTSRFWTRKDSGRKVYRIDGRFWRQEWVEPATRSERVRGDQVPATVFFIVDAEDQRESRDTLSPDHAPRARSR